MERIKRAIFIAAGEGSRMRPVTLEIPKPLIKVNGKRMLDRSIEVLEEYGIREIYLVVGYKKEQFFELYGNVPGIHIIENPDYLKGNNITSMYLVRDYLPGSFVLEADHMIKDASILEPQIEKSGYLASWMGQVSEWLLTMDGDRIVNYRKEASQPGYRLWGISMWTEQDGRLLSEDIAREYEAGNWNQYWDEVALRQCREKYDLGIRRISQEAIMELDTVRELADVDESYKKYLEEQEA